MFKRYNSSMVTKFLVLVGLFFQTIDAHSADACSYMSFRSTAATYAQHPSWLEQLRLERGESILLTPNDGRFPHIYHFIEELWRDQSAFALLVRDSNGHEVRIPLEKIKSVERARPFFTKGERLQVQWLEKDVGIVTRQGAFKGITGGQWRFEELTSNSEWSVSVDLLRAAMASNRGGLRRVDATFWSAKLALVRGEDKVEAVSWQGLAQGVFIDELPDRFILQRDRQLIELEKSKVTRVRRIREFSIPKNSHNTSSAKNFRQEDFSRRSGPPNRSDGFINVPEEFIQTGSLASDAAQTWGQWVLGLQPMANTQHAVWVLGHRNPIDISKHSYRILARRLSPDLNKDRSDSDQKLAEEIFKQVNLAKERIESKIGPLNP
jgi:hypothetical protein